jgi:pyridine nucleotide-disulfide oxidoreductase family protein
MSGASPVEPGSSSTEIHLVLLGAGHVHLHVLQGLARQGAQAGDFKNVRITLVSPYDRQLYSGMVPGFVAGHYALDQCFIPLEQLLRRSHASFIRDCAIGIDACERTVRLAGGRLLHYDLLSIDVGPVMNRDNIEVRMPGARTHALFVRPIETFGQLWPRVALMSKNRKQPLRLALIGAGAAGLELAMAAAYALPLAKVTLVTGGGVAAQNYPPAVQRKVAKALQRLGITVIEDTCKSLQAGQLTLGSGARLACDAPLLAVGADAPPWLADSGLALDDQGFISVNAYQQSTSHTEVFAAGDAATRVDAPLPRSGVYAVRSGPPLLANLKALIDGKTLKAYQPPRRTLNLLSCGQSYAIAIWGPLSVEGRWVWHWKDRIDRRFVAQYT